MKIACVGAGLSGAVIARELVASGRSITVDVYDERPHVAGNCHTERDTKTGVMLHAYGPHIFHTNNETVWSYINRFAAMQPFTNRVKAITARGVYSLPINLLTINQFFDKRFSPREAAAFLGEQADRSIKDPANFEEQALSMLGRDLYENFFRGYTLKQWGVDPRRLPASILKRLPVRFNYDDNYYASRFQGIPKEGYTVAVERMLDHAGISVHLRRSFRREDAAGYDHVFYSGPLDAWYGYEFGRLGYRSLQFERFESTGDHQGNPVVNYCEEKVPWTRITEHKHFTPWETHEGTVCFKEFSKLCGPDDIPYYPLRLEDDKALLQRYVEHAEKDATNVTFVGRLGTYRYLDMHMIIEEALDLAREFLAPGRVAQFKRFTKPPLG